MSTDENTRSIVERVANILWLSSGDSELSDRHYRHANALNDAGLLIDPVADAAGRRALACRPAFDGIQSGNLIFDDPFLLLDHIVKAHKD